jgi:sulfoxide reductase heme-binding subunit YedZ
MENFPMNQKSFSQGSFSPLKALLWVLAGLLIVGMGGLGALAALFFSTTPAGAHAGAFLQWLFAPDGTKVTWYVTRAAGITAYLLLWLSTVWGLLLPSRLLDGKLHGAFTFEFHQFISLLAIAFTFAHVIVLMFDQYAPFSLAQVLFPFLSTYRPLWTGIGILVFYIVLLVSVTFYLRDRIGSKVFRSLHLLSFLAFIGAAVHGLMAGTDSPLPTVQWMYTGTFLTVVFLTVYWVLGRVRKPTPHPAAPASSRPASLNPAVRPVAAAQPSHKDQTLPLRYR